MNSGCMLVHRWIAWLDDAIILTVYVMLKTSQWSHACYVVMVTCLR